MVLKYVGFPSSLKGAKLHDIVSLLRNCGSGRVVVRSAAKVKAEPTFWLLTKSSLDGSFKVIAL